MNGWLIALNTVGTCVYLASNIFGAVNMVKFRKHRTFITGLFYTTASLNILVRINYYAVQYWNED